MDYDFIDQRGTTKAAFVVTELATDRFHECSIANGGNMISMLQFDQSTLANMTAALEYVCRKLPPDKDNPAIRKYIAAEIVAACQKGQTSHGELTSVGLTIVNSYLFHRDALGSRL